MSYRARFVFWESGWPTDHPLSPFYGLGRVAGLYSYMANERRQGQDQYIPINLGVITGEPEIGPLPTSPTVEGEDPSREQVSVESNEPTQKLPGSASKTAVSSTRGFVAMGSQGLAHATLPYQYSVNLSTRLIHNDGYFIPNNIDRDAIGHISTGYYTTTGPSTDRSIPNAEEGGQMALANWIKLGVGAGTAYLAGKEASDILFDAGTGRPVGTDVVRSNMARGRRTYGWLDPAGNFVPARRKRRRARLATCQDQNDMAALKGILGTGKAFEQAIALGRCRR